MAMKRIRCFLVMTTAWMCLGLGTPLWAHAAGTPDVQSGRYLAGNCANCHGTQGKSLGAMPSLAGQKADYLADQMRRFRDGQRPGTIMQKIAKGYTDAQIDAIAAHFAAQGN